MKKAKLQQFQDGKHVIEKLNILQQTMAELQNNLKFYPADNMISSPSLRTNIDGDVYFCTLEKAK